MNAKSLYEEDFHAWALEQARVLRELGARGVALPNDLDLEHVAEEVEDLGNEQRSRVEGNLMQALIHIAKAALFPADLAVRHWRKEVIAFLANAHDAYRPSMRRLIDIDQVWARAAYRLRADLAVDDVAMGTFPARCPLGLDELLAPQPAVSALIDRLRTALPPAPTNAA
jgi:hypothetical protein